MGTAAAYEELREAQGELQKQKELLEEERQMSRSRSAGGWAGDGATTRSRIRSGDCFE